jgi:truncated hemoglobin YjbI
MQMGCCEAKECNNTFEVDKCTLFEQLGGEAAIEATVDLFYKKVLDDSELVNFFSETSMMVRK